MKQEPAFPFVAKDNTGMMINTGMSLRDYFAGQALSGGLEQGVENDMNLGWWHQPSKVAKRAYAIADAMLKARGA
jgi:hypothetical protein